MFVSMRAFFRAIPLFGGLADARWQDHREAISEVSINVLLSTAPIWLGCIFLFVYQDFSIPFGEVIFKNVENGELFIYATSIVAPLYYFIFKDNEVNQKFPNAGSLMIVSAVVLLVGGCGFALTRLGSVLGTSFKWHEGALLYFSFVLYAISLIIVYVAHVYRNWRETGAAAIFATDTQEFVHAFNQGPRS